MYTFKFGLGVVLLLAAPSACKSDEPATHQTSGGEGALDRAGRNIDSAHRQFKKDVKPAAHVVDEKAREVVGEGTKAVNKVADALGGSSSGSARPSPAPKAEPKH